MSIATPPHHSKPLFRGQLHQAAFFIALGACSVLVAIADSARNRTAALIYAASLAGLFGVSSIYHRRYWSLKFLPWLKRLDHAAIFVLIAGTSTPICLLGLGGPDGARCLWTIWTAAVLGIAKEFFWINAPRFLSAIIYVAVGWLAVPYLPEMSAALGNGKLALILVGGILYTAGAVVYATKRPNPFPKVFGYHEIFHALVVVASICHFIVVYKLIRPG